MEFLGSSRTAGPENIWIACSDGDMARVAELLRNGQDVNELDENGYSPIHAAVSYGHIQLVEMLLSAGANVNLTDNDGDTPLHICEQPDMANFLLANGADETALNSEGKSVYEQAVELENEDMVVFWANRLGITLTMQEGDEGEEEWTEGMGDGDDVCEGQAEDGGAPEGAANAPMPDGSN